MRDSSFSNIQKIWVKLVLRPEVRHGARFQYLYKHFQTPLDGWAGGVNTKVLSSMKKVGEGKVYFCREKAE